MVENEATPCQTDRPKGPTSPRERRHEAILDAAEALFMDQGYDRTSLAEIVRRSGGSLATLYELFGNKQGLLHAIAVRWRDEKMQGRVNQVEASDASAVDILMGFVRREIGLWQSPRTVALLRMLVSEGLRDREFVRAARYMGVSNWRIIVSHILPNVASILIIDTTLNVGIAILAETGLSYLGFGIQPPDVSLGTLIADGTPSVTTFPWVFLFPASVLVLIVLCANLIGDGLRDALDPSARPRRRRVVKR